MHLVERHGHLVRKEELLERVWADTNVTEAVLTHCVAEVRQALGDSPRNPRFLKIVPRAGYKFTAEVESGAAMDMAGRESTGAFQPPAIAVLPFANLGGDPSNEVFCDGLAEELINGLTRIRPLRVVAHSSSFSFKGRDTDVREIGRQLGVTTIVEGSVRKVGDHLRVAAQLVSAADGYHLWAEQHDRRIEDVFAIQDEISLAILRKMRVELLTGAEPRLPARRGTSPEAYSR
jgi:TolB-like protein